MSAATEMMNELDASLTHFYVMGDGIFFVNNSAEDIFFGDFVLNERDVPMSMSEALAMVGGEYYEVSDISSLDKREIHLLQIWLIGAIAIGALSRLETLKEALN